MDRATVMVVEDDGELREAIAGLLRFRGFEVLVSEDGEDALRRLRQAPGVRAIVLDIELPVMNGATFRGEQLADPAIAEIPLVLVSGRPDLGQMASVMGAAAFLAKPVDAEVLLRCLEKYR